MLDELIVQIGSAGKPLLPRRVPGSILRLHSTINLTMNTCTDLRLLDVAGAISSLHSLPLPTGQQEVTVAASRTGTGDSPVSQFAPKFAPQSGKRCISGSIPGKTAENRDQHTDVSSIAVSALPVNEKSPLPALVNGRLKEREKGFEPSTSSLGICAHGVVTVDNKELTTTPPAACTAACTRNHEIANGGTADTAGDGGDAAIAAAAEGRGKGEGNDHDAEVKRGGNGGGDVLKMLAEAIRELTDEDRQRLADVLAARGG